MQATHISEKDLLAGAANGCTDRDSQQIKVAHLERSGDISAIRAKNEPGVIEVQVENGCSWCEIK